jgi:hypothetical protein
VLSAPTASSTPAMIEKRVSHEGRDYQHQRDQQMNRDRSVQE